MRIFITDPAGKKHCISTRAKNRLQLKNEIRTARFLYEGNEYHVNDAVAQADQSNSIAGLVIGFLIGCVGGVIGCMIGAGVGMFIGSSFDAKEVKQAEWFNQLKL